jgi:hypothetical protein
MQMTRESYLKGAEQNRTPGADVTKTGRGIRRWEFGQGERKAGDSRGRKNVMEGFILLFI